MTDREPDDLYDALRDRLTDYGQEPPAPLWANIRAQLPPPVAAPQMRRRRWSRVAWLGLLLLFVSVGTWQGWQHFERGNGNQKTTAIVNNQSTTEITADTSATKTDIAAGATSASRPVFKSAENELADASKASHSALNSKSTAANETVATSVAATTPRHRTDLEGPFATIRSRRSGNAAAGSSATSTAGISSREAATVRAKKGRARLEGISATDGLATMRTNNTPTIRAEAGYDTRRINNRRAKDEPLYSALKQGDKEPKAGLTDATRETAASSARAQQPGVSTDASTAGLASADEPLASTPIGSCLPAQAVSFAEWSRLQPRAIALLQSPWAAPSVVPVADTASRAAVSVASRWAVQFLAGPSLTYRQLSQSKSYYTATQTASPTNFLDRSGNATSVPAQEQPTAGFGVQAQVQRVLTGRWSLSTGLGYQEYATKLTIKTVPATASVLPPISTSMPPRIIDSAQIRSVDLRDTYRFLTVPVRVVYELGVGGQRFHVGLVGGLDAAFYLGGATTEGSPCGCESQTWSSTGSPYRPLSLSLSLGASLRYRIAPRWELLAQPTGTYFVNSLVRPTSSFLPRHLLGGSTLLGVSYGLR